MRLDADIIDWLKEDGPGYQTKANHLLRHAMQHMRKENARRVPATIKKRSKAR
jgi:hypothetical protein